MPRTRLQPVSLPDPVRYSHGFRVGNTVYLAGALGTEADGSLSPDIRTQTRRAFDKLATVLREAQGLSTLLAERSIEAVPFVSGRKGIGWHRFRNRSMAAMWSGYSDTPRNSDATRITRELLDAFASPAAEGGVDEIHLVYTEFVSMLTQRPVVHRLLPLEITERVERGPIPIYEFEPSPEAVLNELLPWYVESRIFHALLDAAAAEIAARRRAMKSATDNANELIEALTREANKARQAEITQEISEIVGGANALAETISGSK